MSHFTKIPCKIRSEMKEILIPAIEKWAKENKCEKVYSGAKPKPLLDYMGNKTSITAQLIFDTPSDITNQLGFDFSDEFLRIESDLSDTVLNGLKRQLAEAVVISQATKAGLVLQRSPLTIDNDNRVLKFVKAGL